MLISALTGYLSDRKMLRTKFVHKIEEFYN